MAKLRASFIRDAPLPNDCFIILVALLNATEKILQNIKSWFIQSLGY